LRILAGFLFSFAAVGSARRQKIESREKLKVRVTKFQKFRGTFKTTREDRSRWPKIKIVSRTLGVPPEIETAAEQLKSYVEKLFLSLKVCDVRGKFKSPAGGRTSPAKI